jgi:hypothetical protein
VYALTAHTYKLGFAVNTLINADFKVESTPLIRAAYEATLTAAWIQQVDDALPAYLNRNHNQQKALRDTVKKAGWASGQTAIAADTLTPFLVSKQSKAGASWTEQMCADFFAGDSMYSVYRGLSWLTHPTAVVTDLYVELRDGDDLPTLHNTAHYDDEFLISWLHIMCSSLIWSARALNLIDARRAQTGDRQRLRDWATKLRITEFLAITPEAKFRGQRAERQRARTEDPTLQQKPPTDDQGPIKSQLLQ